MRGLSWHPSSPFTSRDVLEAGCTNARRLLRPPPLAASHPSPCSPLCWLRPRRHAKEQHLAQRPDVLRQSSRHGGRPWLPALGGARAVGRHRLEQGLAYAGMGQTEVIVHLIQHELLAYTVLALAERGDPTSDRRHMLANRQSD